MTPKPLAICLEDLDATSAADQYLRCVAMVGSSPGLRLDAEGGVHWQKETMAAAELWVSGDDQLIVQRRAAATPIMVRRAGRSLEIPCDKPVVLLDQDAIEVGGKRLRVHVHGTAPRIHPPSPLRVERKSTSARMAAVMAVGAAVVGCDRPLEIRNHPPKVAPEPTVSVSPETSATATASATASATTAPATTAPATTAKPITTSPPIEVREHPPDIAIEED